MNMWQQSSKDFKELDVFELMEGVYDSYSFLVVISVCMLHWIFRRDNMQVRNLVLWVLGQGLNSFVIGRFQPFTGHEGP